MRFTILPLLAGGLFATMCLAAVEKEVPEPYRGMKNPLKRAEEALARGRKLYAAYCVGCHGSKGRGDGAEAKARKLPAADFTSVPSSKYSDQRLMWRISEGVPKTVMEGYKEYTSDKDRWSLVMLIRSFNRKSGDKPKK